MDWGRIALLIVPALAGATSAAVLLGPGRPRPVDGARAVTSVRGGATRVVVALRTVRHEGGLYAPRGGLPLIAVVRDGKGDPRGRWEGRSDAAGEAVAEIELSTPLEPGATFAVVGPTGPLLDAALPLASEPVPVRREPWVALVGEVEARLRIPRGVVVPELPEPFVVETTAAPGAAPRLFVDVQGGEASEAGPAVVTCDGSCVHRWELSVTSRAPSTSLTARVELDDREGRLQLTLPLAPGAFWPSPDGRDGEALRLRAPGPRDAAWAFLTTPEGWVRGTKVTMHDDRGGATGLTPPWPWPDGPRALVLAPGPHTESEQSVAWPLGDAAAVAPPAAVTLADPMPALLAAEVRRSERGRWPAIAAILAAALFTFVELARRMRLSQVELEDHLSRELGGADVERVQSRGRLGWLVVLSGGLALAFVALALLTAFAPL